jgi:hypothetical protein
MPIRNLRIGSDIGAGKQTSLQHQTALLAPALVPDGRLDPVSDGAAAQLIFHRVSFLAVPANQYAGSTLMSYSRWARKMFESRSGSAAVSAFSARTRTLPALRPLVTPRMEPARRPDFLHLSYCCIAQVNLAAAAFPRPMYAGDEAPTWAPRIIHFFGPENAFEAFGSVDL